MAVSLPQAQQLAVENNLQIKIAGSSAAISKTQWAAAKAQEGVMVTADGSASYYGQGAGKDATGHSNQVGLSAAYPLYNGGKLSLNTAIMAQKYTQAQLNYERTVQNIRYQATTDYYNVLQAQKTAIVDTEAVTNYASHLQNTRSLYEAGSVPKFDVLTSEVALANARQTLLKATTSSRNAYSVLKNDLGLAYDEPLTLSDDFHYEQFIADLPQCVALALQQRSDYQAAQLNCDIAQKNLALAKTAYKPTVTAKASTGWSTQLLPNDKNYNYNVGVTANWDVFDNGLNQANVATAQNTLQQAQLTRQQLQNNIETQVQQAWLNLQGAQQRLATTLPAVRQGEENLFIARAKYRAGAGIVLDIIDAQLALSTARLNRISAEYDYARSLANLQNTMGKL